MNSLFFSTNDYADSIDYCDIVIRFSVVRRYSIYNHRQLGRVSDCLFGQYHSSMRDSWNCKNCEIPKEMIQKENELTEFQKELVKLFYTYDFSTDERRKDIAIRYSPILLEKIKKDIDISNTKQLLDNAIDYIYSLVQYDINKRNKK